MTFKFDGDHPAVLVGKDNGPTPSSCSTACVLLTAGIGAAAARVKLESVESKIGARGPARHPRTGRAQRYQKIRITFKLKGDAPPEKLRAIVEQSRSRSAVFDALSHGTPIEIDVETA